jgi:hypothetical protein
LYFGSVTASTAKSIASSDVFSVRIESGQHMRATLPVPAKLDPLEVIEGPANLVGLNFEPGLVESSAIIPYA